MRVAFEPGTGCNSNFIIYDKQPAFQALKSILKINNLSTLEDIRPVCILPCVSKVLERNYNKTIKKLLKANKILSTV